MRNWIDTPLGRSLTTAAPAPTPVAPVKREIVRMYAAARPSRLSTGFGATNSSADAELASGLTAMRCRARQLVRDAGYAKRAKRIIQNNVVGTGIRMQAQVETTKGELAQYVNDDIEREWELWCEPEACHAAAQMAFGDLERHLMGQVFEAGEVLVRWHPLARGRSRIPLTLEVLESERLADELHNAGSPAGSIVRLGVEQDAFRRAVAYIVREFHPGEYRMPGSFRSDQVMRVLADQVFHLAVIDRQPQTRGEPWMHAAMRKLDEMDELTYNELVAARGAASYVTVEKTDDEDDDEGERQSDGSLQMGVEPGTHVRIRPDEDFAILQSNRPNQAIDPFMRLLLREVGAAIGVSYESLSRDYGQTTFSSGKLGRLDDVDTWRWIQWWFIRSFRARLHRLFVRQGVLVGAFPGIRLDGYASDPQRYEAAAFKPRGWEWVQPDKEIPAKIEAIKAGLTTRTAVISETGGDIEQLHVERERELKLEGDYETVTTTSPAFFDKAPPAPPAASAAPTDDEKPDDEGDETEDDDEDGERPTPSGEAAADEGARRVRVAVLRVPRGS